MRSVWVEGDPAGDYPLTLVASITPPTRGDGSLFTASHVDVEQDFAYIAYNTAGDVYEGAIDVVNISDLVLLASCNPIPSPNFLGLPGLGLGCGLRSDSR